MAKKKPDHILLGITALILAIGLAALFSASVDESHKNFGNTYSYFIHQLLYGVLPGIVIAAIAYKTNYKVLRKWAFPIIIFSVLLLVFVLVPSISLEVGGARRWIAFGGFSIQPSEFVKLGLIIYLAAWFDAKRMASVKRLGEGLMPFLLIVGTIGGLILLQPDVGTLGLIFLTAIFMYFVAGAKILHLTAATALVVTFIGLLVKIEPYRLNRFISFLNNSADPLGISYQINQSLLAIGSGGFWGVGFGDSVQKYSFLPEAMKDSIFAIWSEETGFIGAMILVVLFVAFALRGLKIAKHANTKFGSFLASGITFWIILQALINIGAMLGLVPLTGIPLPFVSYGGSAMLTVLAGTGILLNISKHTK